jgi:hypothetical protein
MREIIQAIASVDLSDLLTPYAICMAIEIAADQLKSRSNQYTERYGTEIDLRTSNELNKISPKR